MESTRSRQPKDVKVSRTLWWMVAGLVMIALVVTVVVKGHWSESAPPPGSPESQGTRESAQPATGTGAEQRARGAAGDTGRGATPAPVVAVGRMKTIEIPATLSLTATIVSLREAGIVSRVAGYLDTVTVRPGDSIRAGQVVAVVEHSQLDAQVLQAQQAALAAQAVEQSAQAAVGATHAQVSTARAAVRRAEAELVSARAALDRANAAFAVAQASFTRVSTLYSDGLIAAQAVDDAKGQLQSARANSDAAEAQIRVAQAEIDQANEQIQVAQAQEASAAAQVRTQQAQAASLQAALHNARLAQASATIRAPWAGIVISRTLDPGAFVSPGGTTPIMTIADLDRVAVLVNVSEASMGAIRPGMTAEVVVDAFPGRIFHGVIGRIAGGVDPDTRTVPVEIDLPNPDHALRPGMYARASLIGTPRPAHVVPLSAVVTVSGHQFVWVVAEGKVSRRQVTIGATTATVVEITGGLSPDETIVVRGTEMVREGGSVRATPAGQ